IIAVASKLASQMKKPRIASLLFERMFSEEKTVLLHIKNPERFKRSVSMLIQHLTYRLQGCDCESWRPGHNPFQVSSDHTGIEKLRRRSVRNYRLDLTNSGRQAINCSNRFAVAAGFCVATA
ncbi:MAG TPA: hypothetical protein VK522_17530, partial [Pseudolabrys sp.]|nr:hypothetical protein [Pseudolabrys sp.]